MTFDLSLVGLRSEPSTLDYDWRTLALYALGVGAKREELAYLYEHTEGGIRALPTFAVVPAFEPVMRLLAATKADFSMVVHGSQSIHALAPLPPKGKLVTTATLTGIYDMKKFAQLVVTTASELEGRPVYETEWSIIVRNAGGFGGPRPPKVEAPEIPKERPADFVHAEATSPEQALLYRLSGDENPLHADPVFAAKVGFDAGPILHGLATFGFAARAVVKHACGGDASKLVRFAAQFRRPVWPGDVLETSGWSLDGSRLALSTSVVGKEAVLTSAWAELAG
jgi:acyl dehydratase